MRRVLWVVLFVVGVPVLGVGIPLAWVWVASQLQASSGQLEIGPLFVLVAGSLASYLALTAIAARFNRRPSGRPVRRSGWMRSLSDDRGPQRRPTTPIEGMFITAVIVVGLFADVWLVFFDHPGVPVGP